jgi:hypothetical protein
LVEEIDISTRFLGPHRQTISASVGCDGRLVKTRRPSLQR